MQNVKNLKKYEAGRHLSQIIKTIKKGNLIELSNDKLFLHFNGLSQSYFVFQHSWTISFDSKRHPVIKPSESRTKHNKFKGSFFVGRYFLIIFCNLRPFSKNKGKKLIHEIFFTKLLSTIFIRRKCLIYSRYLGRDINVTTTRSSPANIS